MDEQFLQFIWKNGLYNRSEMRTISGKTIEVISGGTHNHNAGPDFVDARIRIGGTMWAGNVEIHCRTSDWRRHQHQNDGAYGSVILHVVRLHDCHDANYGGENIEIYVIKYNEHFEARYRQLMLAERQPQCSRMLPDGKGVAWQHFLTQLAFERMRRRTERIAALLEASKNDWEQAFLQLLFRAFGFGVNAEPLEQLAQSITAAQVAKHLNSLLQLEALLFGQAGFLEESPQNEYQRELQREYIVLRAKFSLSPLPKHMWKFLRIRPPNFPTIRIAQLAALLHSTHGLFAKIVDARSAVEILTLFNVEVSPFWRTHYSFDAASPERVKPLGQKSIERIIANVAAPVIYAYGKTHDSADHCRRAVMLWEELPPEDNAHTALWRKANMPPANMLESQALIELTTEYCAKKRCLRCVVGKLMVVG